MFEPFKDFTERLQGFLDECLSPITPERRPTIQTEDRSRSPTTTVSDSPSGQIDVMDIGRKTERLSKHRPSDNLSMEDLRASSTSECVGSALVPPLPSLIVPPSARLFPATSLAREDESPSLLTAARRSNEVAIRELLQREEKTEVTDAEGRSPLHWAALNGAKRIVELLVERDRDSDFSVRDCQGRTPLHCACLAEHTEIAEILIRSGADAGAVDKEGNTPLHYAALADNDALVACLLRTSASSRTRNCEGHTPVDICGPKTSSRLRDSCRTPCTPRSALINRVPIKRPTPAQVDAFLGKSELPSKTAGPDDYELVHQLGKGSFGEVFLVKRRVDEQLFAMKVLQKDVIMGQNLVKYARTERNILSYVRHPFIVSLSAAFQTAASLFLILDYCPGGDMGWHLAREKRFSEAKARIYACEVLLALEELHNRSIIYRDLKPDNVVFDRQGHALLTDFGLSKEGVADATSAKSFCGSLAYLAPEMLRRQGHGKAVDWYLFGVLLYEMLTGTPPYYSSDRDQLFHNILHATLTLPHSLSPEARSLIREVSTIQLLERDPSKRLGASARDAEDVKRHAFFRGIHWDAVLRRELSPPVLTKPLGSGKKSLGREVMQTGVTDTKTHVEGWSFVSH